jgi:hypothetical protein
LVRTVIKPLPSNPSSKTEAGTGNFPLTKGGKTRYNIKAVKSQ